MKVSIALWSAILARASIAAVVPASYNETFNTKGKMDLTRRTFDDGFVFNVYSPKERNVTVTKNDLPVDGRFVTGYNGSPWVGLLPYSWIISTGDNATDFIGKLEAPYDSAKLKSLGVTTDNTFIGRLSEDGDSWIVDETTWGIHRATSKTILVKQRALDGEYRLLGRRGQDSGASLIEYGFDRDSMWNISGGGQQVGEWEDGLRLQLSCTEDASISVSLDYGVDVSELPPDSVPLNPYKWVMRTTIPGTANIVATMRIPINKNSLRAVYKSKGIDVPKAAAVALTWRRKEVNKWGNIIGNVTISKDGSAYELSDLEFLSGEYVIVVNPNAPAPTK